MQTFSPKTLLELYQESDPLHCIIEETPELGAVYLGNIDAASSYEILRQHKIKAVLTVAARTGLKYNENMIAFHEVIVSDDHPS